MNLFDILGPVMVGPSSSHTAGAVRIGYISEKLLQDHVRKAEILCYHGNRTRYRQGIDCRTSGNAAG